MFNPKCLTAALAALPLVLPIAFTASAEVPGDMVRAEMLSGWRMENGAHMSALRLTLAPGWKTYWRAPGDGGIPPLFDWTGSGNLSGVTMSWPVPEVFYLNGMRSVGYAEAVIIPIEFRPTEDGAPIAVSGRIDIGVCEDICVPVSLVVAADLAPGGASDPRITAALDDRPMTRGEAGVRGVDCVLEPISDGLRLTATITMPQIGRDEETVVELTGAPVWVSEPEVTRQGATLRTVADLVPPEAAPFALERDALRFTVIADGQAVDIQGCG
jgi:DsbC/DsbD-like thiol-disulfide interchange protein